MDHVEILGCLRQAAAQGMNVLLEGPHGTGKTSLVCQIAEELDLHIKYFSTATLDPFVDLVGLPVPRVDEDGRNAVVYHRQTDIADAELLFFDELNRAQPKTLNAVLEIIQFCSINGDPLPRLKAVFAACNPLSTEYNVVELDAALKDRFHMHLAVEPIASIDWFRAQFGRELGDALCDWYDSDLDDGQRGMVSPRRLEYIGQMTAAGINPASVMDCSGQLPFRLLTQRLKAAESVIGIPEIVADPLLYAGKVSKDMNLAIRVAHLLTRMKPDQQAACRDVILALPAEMLATMQSECPFVFRNASRAIAGQYGLEEAQAFDSLLDERMKECGEHEAESNQRTDKAA